MVVGEGVLGLHRLAMLLVLYATFLKNVVPTFTRRNNGGVAKRIVSRGGRPVVKMDVLVINASANAIASFSNGCALGMPRNGGRLRFSCIKCRAGVITLPADNSMLGMRVGDSSRMLDSMIIVKCKARQGDSLANSMAGIDDGSFGVKLIDSPRRLVGKGVSNIRVVSGDNSPATKDAVHIHNNTSLGTDGSPLVILSNIPLRRNNVDKGSKGFLDLVGPGSVRDVAVLGSTSSATVCNSHTSGKMVLVAAGGKASSGLRVAFDAAGSVRAHAGLTSVLDCSRFIGAVQARKASTRRTLLKATHAG